MHLNEWGLGGRGFGTFVSWFLLGGDIYTAYTFIAVPALVYAAGAAGFYALSYTIMVWPIVFVFGPRLWYRALRAQALAEERARRPKTAKLAGNDELRDWVQRHLEMKWSPEQISARLVIEFPRRRKMRVSHETIYQSIYVQGRGRCGGSWPGACGPGGRCASRGARTMNGAGRSRGW